MKIEITKDNFLAGMEKVQGLAGRGKSLPILSNVLLEAKDGKLALTGSSLDITIRESVDAVVEEPGAVCLNAKKLYEIVRELPEETTKVTVDEKFHAKIKSGKSAFKLTGLDKKEFPAVPAVASVKTGMVKVDVAVLAGMLKKTVYAVGDQHENRAGLRGALFIMAQNGTDIKSHVAASDGHRLSILDVTIPGTINDKVRAIIPKEALQELSKFMEDDTLTAVEIGFTENQAIIQRGDATFLAKLIDASFPNYKQAIPTDKKATVTVPREAIMSALKRVAILAGEKGGRRVVMDFRKDLINLSSHNPESGRAEDSVEAVTTGDNIKMAFNCRYLQDAIASLDSKNVEFRLIDNTSPCVVGPEGDANHIAIVMPMQL